MAAPMALADIALSPGDVVRERYRVVEKLGEGGFGAVYKVESMRSKEEYALKLESKKEQDSMVKVEAIVLQKLTSRKMLQHACRFIDEGETPVFRFVVMQLLGRSLSDLRKSAKNQSFSPNTTIRLGMQALEAIENLHRIGFLHRDIKPGNFAMGRKDSDKRILFMLDYGLCRQFVAPDGQLRPQRKTAGFRGTVRYASINCHLRKELGRHDDIWCLYYMLIEMRSGELPWKKVGDKDAVLKKKQETPLPELLRCVNEPEFVKMHDQLQKLTYDDMPNYVWFQLQLKAIAVRNRYNNLDPFDWEPGGESYDSCCKPAPRKSKKKKGAPKKEKVPGEEKEPSVQDSKAKDKEDKAKGNDKEKENDDKEKDKGKES